MRLRICEICGLKFEARSTDEAALAEADAIFKPLTVAERAEGRAVIGDCCWPGFLAWARQEGLLKGEAE